MIIDQWLRENTNDQMHMSLDGECVLNDKEGNHYVTIKDQGEQVFFIYSLFISNPHKDIYKDALLLNANPSFLGQAHLAIADDGETLALSVYGPVQNTEQIEALWQQAQDFRYSTIECLESAW